MVTCEGSGPSYARGMTALVAKPSRPRNKTSGLIVATCLWNIEIHLNTMVEVS